MNFDFEALPPVERYKLVTSTVVPRPIAWIVSQDAEGVVNAAPYSFFNAFSNDPVVIGVGCGPRPEGSLKDTLANVKATGQFTVCLVPYSAMEGMNITATDFPPGTDEIAAAGLTTVPSVKVKPPRIAESPVALECETFQIIPVGHHNILLGKVVGMYVADEAVLNAEKHYIDTPKLDLVGRMHGGGWYTRTTDRFEVPRIPYAKWLEQKG